MLALKVGEVWQNGKPVSDLLFDKTIVKGGEVSTGGSGERQWQKKPLNGVDRRSIRGTLSESIDVERVFCFHRRQGDRVRWIVEWHTTVLKTAFEAAGLNGKLATHSMRKSFAQRLYEQTNDIFAVQEMLGHKNVATTQRYLGVNYASVRDAVEKMAFTSEYSIVKWRFVRPTIRYQRYV